MNKKLREKKLAEVIANQEESFKMKWKFPKSGF